MISNLNYLLVGNTRLHWAKKKNNKFSFFHTDLNQIFSADINSDNLIWASVGNSPKSYLKKENEIQTKDIKLKKLPKHFGVDRALGCFAALKEVKNPSNRDLLIADCGTTLSLTKISSKGEIIGGQLIPGLITQLRSMEKNTKNLKFPKNIEIPNKNFLIKTESAMIKGVLNSLIGAVSLSFNPQKDILIICGGDSELVSEGFKRGENVICNPNLVMLGMIMHNELSNEFFLN